MKINPLCYLLALFFVISACKSNIELESKVSMHYKGHNSDILKIISDINAEGKLNYLNSDKNSKSYYFDWDKILLQGSLNNRYSMLIIVPYLTGNTLIGYLEANVDYKANILSYKMIKPNASEKRFETVLKIFKGQGLNLNSNIFLNVRAFAANNRIYSGSKDVDFKSSNLNFGKNSLNSGVGMCFGELVASYTVSVHPTGACTLVSSFNIILNRIDLYFKTNATAYQVSAPFDLIRIAGPSDIYSAATITQHMYQAVHYIRADPCFNDFTWHQVTIFNEGCEGPPPGDGGNNPQPGGGGGGGTNPQPGNPDMQEFDINQKPLQEFANKCDGLQAAWNNHPNNEVFGLITMDNKFIVTDIINIMGGQVSKLFEWEGKLYYSYKDTQGAPSLIYEGMLHSGGYYYIPVKASVHTHPESRNDGTNGLDNYVSEHDSQYAGKYSSLKHYVIGNGAVGTFNEWSTSYSVTAHGSISSTCASIL